MSKFSSIINTSLCSCTGDTKCNSRYSLYLAFTQQFQTRKTAIVILKNPSTTANANLYFNVSFQFLTDVDQTTEKVYTYLSSFNYYNDIIVLNLLPYYSSRPSVLNEIYPKSSQKHWSYNQNLSQIDIHLRNNNNKRVDVICAWGRNNAGLSKIILDQAVDDVESIINKYNKYNVIQLNKNNKQQFIGYNTTVPRKSARKHYPLHGQVW